MIDPSGNLQLLPCLDSGEMAAARRRELDVPHERGVELGWSAVEAAKQGYFVNQSGEKVDWSLLLETACSAKLSISPDASLPTPEPVDRAYWVVEGKLLAGAYPGAPDPDEHRRRVKSLWDLGIRTFVNLVEENETNNSGEPFRPYDDLLRNFAVDGDERVAHLRFPVKDMGVPSADRMRTILDSIDMSLGANRPVYVHCFGGVGRTGVTICCWLIRNGFATNEDVMELLAELRRADSATAHRPAPENHKQVQFVSNWM